VAICSPKLATSSSSSDGGWRGAGGGGGGGGFDRNLEIGAKFLLLRLLCTSREHVLITCIVLQFQGFHKV
jgi:hypothetical protein